MYKEYKFCPNCKSDLKSDHEKVFCENCDYIFYKNPAPTVAALPIKENKVLLTIRKIEPYLGAIDILGGFVKPNESAEEATIREVKEESGLDIKITKYINSYADTYGDDGKPVLSITYIVDIVGGVQKANDDVAELVWVDINGIPNLNFNGFKNTKTALMDIYDLYSRGAEN